MRERKAFAAVMAFALTLVAIGIVLIVFRVAADCIGYQYAEWLTLISNASAAIVGVVTFKTVYEGVLGRGS